MAKSAQLLTIELPAAASIPEVLKDTMLVRYLLAGGLYAKGVLSGKEARALTGDDRRTFEETMSRHGFPMMPDDDDDLS